MTEVSAIDGHHTLKPTQPSKSPVERLLADARLRLVETGTRNRLVHTPRNSNRKRSLPVLNITADGLFDDLTQSTRALRFLPNSKPDADLFNGDGKVVRIGKAAGPGASTNGLQTNLEAESLERRLLAIYRDARTAEEEQGINILFLAIGFLRWYEDDKSTTLREAPLILVPVSLIRDLQRNTFDLRARDEDIITNQAIQERLRTDFGIVLPDLPDGDEWKASSYFTAVRSAIATKPRWSIDTDGVELGFYSFSKLLMIRDLDPDAWESGTLLEHPLLRGLLTDGFNEEPLAFDGNTNLDKVFAPADLIQVVDADSSQTVVIESVRAGRNLVVQGPPGTGKSQTITNIIASAVHDGKSVLFVAEKMAALDVVHARLRTVGLGSVCLELHSRSANKKLVLGEIKETLDHAPAEPDSIAETARLTHLRDTLNAATQRLHAPIGAGLTAFQVLSRMVTATDSGISSHPALFAEASSWSATDYASVVEQTARLSEISLTAGSTQAHPYYGVEAIALQPAELSRLSPALGALADAARALLNYSRSIANDLISEEPSSIECSAAMVEILNIVRSLPANTADLALALEGQKTDRAMVAAQSGRTWKSLRDDAGNIFVDAAFDADCKALRLSLTHGLTFFGRFGKTYRHASNLLGSLTREKLPKKVQGRIDLVDQLIAVENASAYLKSEDAGMVAMLPQHWRGAGTDFETLHTVAAAVHKLSYHPHHPKITEAIAFAADSEVSRRTIGELNRLIDQVTKAIDGIFPILRVDMAKAFSVRARERIALSDLAGKAELWRDAQSRFDEWRRLSAADARLRVLPAKSMADAMSCGDVSADKANAVLECTHAEAVWTKAVSKTPALGEFYGPSHEALISEFAALERKRRGTAVEIVKGRHAANMPRGNYGAMNTIRSEIARKRGHMPIRKLFRTAGETLQRIKPVLLMSPISVAQFLPPGAAKFDLLVIDEASQVRPEDSLGLIARAKQIVVVGDNKQLPPTSFFDRIVADEEEGDDDDITENALGGAAKATDLESVLALCDARGLNSMMLRWHYRSRHPSLIEVSNAEFYKHLIMPPAPASERLDDGLILRRVAGAYDRGGKRVNMIEAEIVANAVAAHAKAHPEQSLGVVTFSTVQRDAIGDLLDFKRRSDDALDGYLREGKGEDVFVKNLENVQGDERDIILVSVGYGPRTPGGRMDSMAFGPISGEGGERRLNVLFTRARSRCEIFVSFDSGDIDLNRAKGEGPRILKRFLQYAETGILEEQVSTSEDADSPFEEAVAAFIEGQGYKVDKQVGSSGFKIDLAVRHPDHPGRYMLAVECDGAAYHRALWARERDRMRQEILENMGWRFHRIWSTDWFYRRGEAAARLLAAIEAAKSAPIGKKSVATKIELAPTTPSPSVDPAPTSVQIPAYQVTSMQTPFGEPQDLNRMELAKITGVIVKIEGPIHEDEVGRRVAQLFGKARTGSQISFASQNSLSYLKSSGQLVKEGDFWMTAAQRDDAPVRDRRSAPTTLQKADMLSPHEIRAAAKIAMQENGSLSDDDMAVAVTRMLGFKRTGPDLKAAIAKALRE